MAKLGHGIVRRGIAECVAGSTQLLRARNGKTGEVYSEARFGLGCCYFNYSADGMAKLVRV